LVGHISAIFNKNNNENGFVYQRYYGLHPNGSDPVWMGREIAGICIMDGCNDFRKAI
jgi:hypothetical protein